MPQFRFTLQSLNEFFTHAPGNVVFRLNRVTKLGLCSNTLTYFFFQLGHKTVNLIQKALVWKLRVERGFTLQSLNEIFTEAPGYLVFLLNRVTKLGLGSNTRAYLLFQLGHKPVNLILNALV